jgi:hypothetical protein
MSRYQNAEQNQHLMTANKSVSVLEKFSYYEQQQQIKIAFMRKLRAD